MAGNSNKEERWIQGAIKRPGAFTKYCKSIGYDKVTESCIARGLRSKSERIRKEANLARTLRRMAKKRKKKGQGK